MKAVNLLPSDQRGPVKSSGASRTSAPKGDPFGAYVVIGALALAVVAMVAYVLTSNTIKDRETQLAQVNAEAAAVKAKASELQPFADFQSLAAQRVSTVQGLASSRFDWEAALRDLSRALPRDVHLKSLKGSTASGLGTTGGSGLRGSVQAPAIELAGCTSSQSGVARLMSRLRAVRGVTRVSLSKSDKDGSGAGVASSAGGASGGSLCRAAGFPAFELVVFFERAAVPTTARPNAAAGQNATSQPSGGSTASGATNPSPTSTNSTPGGSTAPGTTATNPAAPNTGAQSGPATVPHTTGVSSP